MDISSMQSLNRMVGTEEDVTTYPEFMHGPTGELIFHYRYGRSGNGYEVYNVWDAALGQWKRMTDRPIIDGEGKRNAYMQGPTVGPNGYFHLIWVWRESPDCSSNHTLSYARSRDLIHWESIRGEAVPSPITLKDSVLVVDDTPEKGGLINIGIKLGFDSEKRPVIAYHKYDSVGHTQLYLTRYEDGAWKRSQLTEWDYRWNFNGWGTVVNEMLIDAPYVSAPGELCYGYFRMDVGEHQVIADEKTLKPLREEDYAKEYPDEVEEHESDYPGLIVYKVKDSGAAPAGKEYILRWEALSPNRDQRRTGDVPQPMKLKLYELER